MDAYLRGIYQQQMAREGFKQREHPNAVYVFVYLEGDASDGAGWIGRVAKAAADHSPTFDNNLVAGDPLYTEAVIELLMHGVEGIDQENSYPIQLCLNELLQNVFEWAHSPVGCFVLARWYKKTQSVRLAVVDRGIGVPAALRRAKVKGLHRKPDEEVIEAAVTMKHLTSRANQVGGLGLKTVREVVCGTKGTLMIASLSGKVAWSGTQGKLRKYKAAHFRGTAIEIDIRPGGHDTIPRTSAQPF